VRYVQFGKHGCTNTVITSIRLFSMFSQDLDSEVSRVKVVNITSSISPTESSHLQQVIDEFYLLVHVRAYRTYIGLDSEVEAVKWNFRERPKRGAIP